MPLLMEGSGGNGLRRATLLRSQKINDQQNPNLHRIIHCCIPHYNKSIPTNTCNGSRNRGYRFSLNDFGLSHIMVILANTKEKE